MKKWKVRIKATVTKDIVLNAETEEEADVAAHEIFNIFKDEKYEQDTVNIKEVSNAKI